MYCSQCGKELPNNSKFCYACGCSVPESVKTVDNSDFDLEFDSVEDIKLKLEKIGRRRRTSTRHTKVSNPIFDVLKQTIEDKVDSLSSSFFDDKFKEKKISDKKDLIRNYPLPTLPNSLVNFARYINSEIISKKKDSDDLVTTWREKLKQVYLFAKKKYSNTEEFLEIQALYKTNKRNEIRTTVREFVILLAILPIILLVYSIICLHPILMFLAIWIIGWQILLILYLYDLLDGIIASIKKHSVKLKNTHKILCLIALFFLIPFLAVLITSIIFQVTALITLFAVLFGLAFFYLVFTLLYVYE